jgi:hypothetical protein
MWAFQIEYPPFSSISRSMIFKKNKTIVIAVLLLVGGMIGIEYATQWLMNKINRLLIRLAIWLKHTENSLRGCIEH